MAGKTSAFWDEWYPVARQMFEAGKQSPEIAAHISTESGRKVSPAAVRMKLRDGHGSDTGEGNVVASEISERITSLDELLKQSKTDLTKWVVERHVVNKWEVGAKHPVTGKILVAPLWQVKAWLKPVPTSIRTADAVWAEMLARFGKERKRPRLEIVSRKAGHYLLCLNPFDVHLGKLAYAPETGEHYDLRIAADRFRACRDELLAMATGLPLGETVIPLGNDYFHTDNLSQTTTGGTPQDSDTRFAKMFTTGVELAIETIELAAKHAPVLVPIVPGNHDRQSAFTLGCVLEAYFRGEKRVVIDNRPVLRKYHRYGVNLIGWTHGSEEKQADLAVIMATEAPVEWSQTEHREWHVGHVHKMKGLFGDSIRGVRIRVMPSISGTDAWHAAKGYKDRPAMEAYLYHVAKGYAGHFSSNVMAEAA